jgi:glycosyltransferase A (GT-A) superfamily protein (DUF2064 family)
VSDALILVLTHAADDERRFSTLRARGGAQRIEALHHLLVDRALAAAAAAPARPDVRLVSTGDLARARRFALRRVPAERLQMTRQRDIDPRLRFAAAVTGAFVDGYRTVLVLDDATPELGREQVAEAFGHLAAGSAVVGPTDDGGTYLVGLIGPLPSPAELEVIDLRAAEGMVAALTAAGRPLATLAPLARLDSIDDARALSARLRDARTADDLLLRFALLDVLSGDGVPAGPPSDRSPTVPLEVARIHH